MNQNFPTSDHDLLITLLARTDEGFKALHESMQDIKTSMEKKANSEYVGTLAKRIDEIEKDTKATSKKIWLFTGGAVVAQLVLVEALNFFSKH